MDVWTSILTIYLGNLHKKSLISKCRWGEAGGGFETGGEVLGIAETAGIGDLFDGEIRLL